MTTQNAGRFMFTPFWKMTRWGWLPDYILQINEGCDGIKRSKYVIVPMVGEFCWFEKNECGCRDCGLDD